MRADQSISNATQYPIGLAFDVTFKEFSVRLTVLASDRLRFDIAEGPFAKTEEVIVAVSLIRPGVFLVSWVEHSGATVVHVEDFSKGTLYSHATLPGGTFLRMEGAINLVN
ncbi:MULTISPECIES: hypothetical protein [unclassified Roseateles]|uniref:MoaF-related domain-containing protein n=1 Tax=unclassified Roseateles TaxID=2626991 RepID=UPI0006F567FF|nr:MULTISPECIES: hypothetical protein [unclassified Roseateles]KQW49551.1 hypothetical protein ASC81_25880 [Pelomonas sp. Root405]KRA75609.1 hypothetical protein ASD88_25865 [Pelomonas sp. Root662]